MPVATSHAAPDRTAADAVWLATNSRSSTRTRLAALDASGHVEDIP